MEMCGRINYMILRMGFLQLNMEAGSEIEKRESTNLFPCKFFFHSLNISSDS